MNRNVMLRILIPAAGIVLTAALVAQARQARSIHQRGGEAVAKEAAAISAAAGGGTSPLAGQAASIRAEGRVAVYPGGEVVVGTDIAGTLVTVAVREMDRVRRGQPLASILADDLRAELDETRARRGEADAEVRLADTEIARYERLVAVGVTPAQELDRRLRDRDAARARRATAEASIARLNALLDKTRITSPLDGVVVTRQADGGETLERGDPIVTIADLSHLRVEAEVDEFDAGRVALGAQVLVTAEGFDGQIWRGRVEEIPDVVAQRALKPQDPARPTDTRVLLVKVALLDATPLKLGQRVQVAIGPATRG